MRFKSQKVYIYLSLIFIFSFLFLHISFIQTGNSNEVHFSYYVDLASSPINTIDSSEISNNENVPIFTFHSILNDQEFWIIKLDRQGNLIENFILSDIPKKKKGYITYPLDGSYFIWYPTLGSKSRIYDSKGNFLWDTPESRYLQSNPDTRWIMAFSGDHSAVEYMKLNFESILKVEGFMLVDHDSDQRYGEISAKDENIMYDTCIAFLNGEIVFTKLIHENPKSIRVSLGIPLKSIDCNFKDGFFLAQIKSSTVEKESSSVEKKDSIPRDVIVKGYLDSLLKDINSFQFKIELPASYPVSLPLRISKEGIGSTLVPNEDNGLEIWLFDDLGNIIKKYHWPEKLNSLQDLFSFRADKTDYNFIYSNDQSIILLNQEGILFYKKFSDIQKIVTVNDIFIIQDVNSIYAFEIR